MPYYYTYKFDNTITNSILYLVIGLHQDDKYIIYKQNHKINGYNRQEEYEFGTDNICLIYIQMI